MPFKGLPKCQHCKLRGNFSRSWHVVSHTPSQVALRCEKCGGGTLSRSQAAFRLVREMERAKRKSEE
jgi:hypothetical protein